MKYLKKLFESDESSIIIDYLESMFIDIIESDLYKVEHYKEDYPNADKGPITEWYLLISPNNNPDGFFDIKEMFDYIDNVKNQALRLTEIIEYIKEEYSNIQSWFYYKNKKNVNNNILFEISFAWENKSLKQ